MVTDYVKYEKELFVRSAEFREGLGSALVNAGVFVIQVRPMLAGTSRRTV